MSKTYTEKELQDLLEKSGNQINVAELDKKKNSFWTGALIGGTGGAIVTSIVFMLIQGFCK